MPRMFNPGGQSNPGWSLGDLGGETYQGPANAGSNNFGAGPLNGQTMGNNNYKPKGGGVRGGFPTLGTGGGNVMPNLNNSVGNASMAGAPSWAVGNWGNETWVGPANAGSNNYGAGPLNGQTMGNNNGKAKGPRFGGNEGPTAQNSFGTDAFGFPISSAAQASGAGLQQLNAYRDYNQAVQNWINQTGFTGEGGYSAFQLANPNWVSQYGPMNTGGAGGLQAGTGGQGAGFGSGQPWTPGPNFGQMPNQSGQMVPSIGNPTPGGYGQPTPGAGTTMGPTTGGVKPSQPTTAPVGLTTGTTWGASGGR